MQVKKYCNSTQTTRWSENAIGETEVWVHASCEALASLVASEVSCSLSSFHTWALGEGPYHFCSLLLLSNHFPPFLPKTLG